MRPVPGVRLTVICRESRTPYSGMLPGYVAGHYGFDEVHIDLRRLAHFAGARFYRDEAIGLDRDARKVLCASRPPVSYDLLSINIGSTPRMDDVAGAAELAVPVKPISAFNERWLELRERIRSAAAKPASRWSGGGAGGVELALAMQYRLRNELRAAGRNPDDLVVHLLSGEPDILPTHNARVRKAFSRVLAERGITVHRGSRVTEVAPGRLRIADGSTLDADDVVWVTRASGAPWLRGTGLALDDERLHSRHRDAADRDRRQCVRRRRHRQHGRTPAGKGGRVCGPARTAAGRRTCAARSQGQPLAAYRPQKRWLALISTGDQYAVASRGALGFEGRWVWRWKDWIDRRFMARYSELPAMPEAARAHAAVDPPRQRTNRAGDLGDRHALRRLRRQGGRLGASRARSAACGRSSATTC